MYDRDAGALQRIDCEGQHPAAITAATAAGVFREPSRGGVEITLPPLAPELLYAARLEVRLCGFGHVG